MESQQLMVPGFVRRPSGCTSQHSVYVQAVWGARCAVTAVTGHESPALNSDSVEEVEMHTLSHKIETVIMH